MTINVQVDLGSSVPMWVRGIGMGKCSGRGRVKGWKREQNGVSENDEGAVVGEEIEEEEIQRLEDIKIQ